MVKLCRFNESRLGLVDGAAVADVTAALDVLPEARWPLPARGDLLIRHLDEVCARVAETLDGATRHDLSDVELARHSNEVIQPEARVAEIAQRRKEHVPRHARERFDEEGRHRSSLGHGPDGGNLRAAHRHARATTRTATSRA